MNPQLVIGLGSTRRVGKDTLARLLGQLDSRFVPYSFASPLKNDLAPFLQAHFDIDIWTCSEASKEWVRPLLISYGMAQRARDPDYWVKRTLRQIQVDLKSTEHELIPVLTDVRFINEATIFRATFSGFKLINVTRNGAPSPTDEEEKHWRGVAALADYHFQWGHNTEEEQLARAREVIKWLGL